MPRQEFDNYDPRSSYDRAMEALVISQQEGHSEDFIEEKKIEAQNLIRQVKGELVRGKFRTGNSLLDIAIYIHGLESQDYFDVYSDINRELKNHNRELALRVDRNLPRLYKNPLHSRKKGMSVSPETMHLRLGYISGETLMYPKNFPNPVPFDFSENSIFLPTDEHVSWREHIALISDRPIQGSLKTDNGYHSIQFFIGNNEVEEWFNGSGMQQTRDSMIEFLNSKSA